MDFHQIFLGKSVSTLWCLSAFQQERHVSSIKFDMKTATTLKKAYLYRTVHSYSVVCLLLWNSVMYRNTSKEHCVFVNLHIMEIYPLLAKKDIHLDIITHLIRPCEKSLQSCHKVWVPYATFEGSASFYNRITVHLNNLGGPFIHPCKPIIQMAN